ncbi:MAG: LCP family protein [Spirochaetia bacterium]|nr:LCP family protein [Spirochaetia bacterium]
MSDRSIFHKSNIILLAIILVAVGTVIYLFGSISTDSMSSRVEAGSNIPFLFVVSDDDKLIFSEVFIYNPSTGKSVIVDIPYNYGSIMKSNSSDSKYDSIGTLYRNGRPDNFIKKVEDITGVDIDFYICMELADLADLADLVEGLEIFVANPVNSDNGGALSLIPSGSVVLDGDKVLEYIRFYENEGSRASVADDRQRLIQSLIKRIGEKSSYIQDKDVFSVFCRKLDTNLSPRGSLRTFISEMTKVDCDHMIMQRVMGDEKNVDGKILLFAYNDGALMKESIKQRCDALSNTEAFWDDNSGLSLAILNGTHISGLASRTSVIYSNYGYDVRSVRNAEFSSEYENTMVMGHKHNFDTVQKVAGIIKCRNISFYEDNSDILKDMSDVADMGDIILILGKDFDGSICR